MNEFNNIKCANSIPVHAPRYAENSVNPYSCTDYRSYSILFRTKKEIIEKYLSVTPFKATSDTVMLEFSDFANYDGEEGPYRVMSLVLPVEHMGLSGGYRMFTYTNNRDVILRDREVFGYPDKYAYIDFSEDDTKISCSCFLKTTGLPNTKKLAQLNLYKNRLIEKEYEKPILAPDILLKTMGRPEGPGILYELALSRNTAADFKMKEQIRMEADIELLYAEMDPLDEFEAIEIIGGMYTKGDYFSTEKNGWAQIREEVIPLKD